MGEAIPPRAKVWFGAGAFGAETRSGIDVAASLALHPVFSEVADIDTSAYWAFHLGCFPRSGAGLCRFGLSRRLRQLEQLANIGLPGLDRAEGRDRPAYRLLRPDDDR